LPLSVSASMKLRMTRRSEARVIHSHKERDTRLL
jgi:hypothetical protein